jgi:hypothetical protein
MKTRFLSLAVLVLCVGMASSPKADASLILTAMTDQSSYLPYEPIAISITVENTDGQDVWLTFPDTRQADYTMDGVYNWAENHGAFFNITHQLLPAYGSHSWTLQHDFEDYYPAPGDHLLVGRLLLMGDVQTAAPISFTVVPEPCAIVMLATAAVCVLACTVCRRKM